MKSFKTLMAGLLVVAFATAAHATTTERIYIVGSTAFRASTHTAIINTLNSGGAYTFAYSTSSGASNLGAAPGSSTLGSGASQQIYSGTIAGFPVIIKTNWSGSTGGVQQVTQPIITKFMTDASLTGATSSGIIVAGTVTDSETPTVTMTDGHQSSTPFTSPVLTPAGGKSVGVVPFVFCINKDWIAQNGTAAPFNVNPQIARNLWANGSTPLALFTGNHADEGSIVIATGRDFDSGTRLNTFAETGIGIFSTVFQYQPQFGGSATSLTLTGSGAAYSSAPTVVIYGSGGYGYSSAPSVGLTGGGGTGFAATCTMGPTASGSTVIAVNISSGGSGYTSVPTVTFTGGSPTVAASASAVLDSLGGGDISQVTLANPGSGASATATLSGSQVSGFTGLVGGSGFQAAPTVALIGGGGSGATATATAGNYVTTGLIQWPAETVDGIGFIAGNGGYASGGSLAVALGTTGVFSNFSGYLLGYLGLSDASTASGLTTSGTFSGSGLGAKVCTYNGVAYSATAVEEGQYTFWANEFMNYNSLLDANGITIANAIANQISTSDAVITLPQMQVSRATDGGVVSADY